MGSETDDQSELLSSLLLRVGPHLCALPLAFVVETMRPLPVEPFSGAPAAVTGLTLIRGIPTPVIELSALLDGAGASEATRFVTVRSGEHQIALAVDSVVGLRKIPAGTLRNLPPLLGQGDTNVVSAIGTLDAELLLSLNSARLVPDGLWQAMNELAAAP